MNRARLLISLLAAAVACCAIAAAGIGPVALSVHTVMLGFLQHVGILIGPKVAPAVDTILWQVRIPRIILEMLVGGALSAAGVAFQALLRNDLAEPYTTGVSGGASVGWGLVVVAGGSGMLAGLAPTLAAFAGGLLTLVAVYTLARIQGRIHVQSLLLSGVVMGAFLWSVQMILLKLAGKTEDQILGWLMGSLASASWSDINLLTPLMVVGLVILASQTYGMNIYALGEESAKQLGVETERFKATMMIVGALLTAGTVAVAGIIGFVGLVVPHLARKLARTSDHRIVLPASVLGGALMLILSDTISRSVFAGEALPVGVVTALLGCPFFFYLLRTAGSMGYK